MTKVVFYGNPSLLGFCVEGHSTADENDDMGRLVCSAVSSAAYMAANTITEIIGDEAEIAVSDAKMELMVKSPSDKTDAVLNGFKLHMEQLAAQYKKNIKISSEVHL